MASHDLGIEGESAGRHFGQPVLGSIALNAFYGKGRPAGSKSVPSIEGILVGHVAGSPQGLIVQKLILYFLSDTVQANLLSNGAAPMIPSYVSPRLSLLQELEASNFMLQGMWSIVPCAMSDHIKIFPVSKSMSAI